MRLKVLDHGYVMAVETWGSDARIVESARMSTQAGFRGWGDEAPCRPEPQQSRICERGMSGCRIHHVGDEKLLSYLWTHQHATPFEMAGMTVEVSAPLFVFREWHRHRTQSYSEASARYGPLPDVNYQPTAERIRTGVAEAGQNRQAGSTQPLNEAALADWLRLVEDTYHKVELVYRAGLAAGVPKEVARVIMPVGRYSTMRASANLRNWLAFLTLRLDRRAQWEIRQYAEAVAGLLRQAFPRTLALFEASRVEE